LLRWRRLGRRGRWRGRLLLPRLLRNRTEHYARRQNDQAEDRDASIGSSHFYHQQRSNLEDADITPVYDAFPKRNDSVSMFF
jgi:hypothetical protein